MAEIKFYTTGRAAEELLVEQEEGSGEEKVSPSAQTHTQDDQLDLVEMVAERAAASAPEPEPEPEVLELEPIEGEVISPGSKSRKPPTKESRKRATEFPSSNGYWDASDLGYGVGLGLTDEEVRSAFLQFKDYSAAKGNKYIDWHAAFRTWCRNEVKFKAQRGGGRRQVGSIDEQMARAAALKAELDQYE